MDIYLSSVSNRLNQVMKVLTIISTIFIPLTFIVGVYGMNFVYFDEQTNTLMPFNMPELHSPYGYIGVLVAMVLIVILQMAYFFKKGWLVWSDRNRQ
jgi:magnesium transporter